MRSSQFSPQKFLGVLEKMFNSIRKNILLWLLLSAWDWSGDITKLALFMYKRSK
jgi:hypothetical protein